MNQEKYIMYEDQKYKRGVKGAAIIGSVVSLAVLILVMTYVKETITTVHGTVAKIEESYDQDDPEERYRIVTLEDGMEYILRDDAYQEYGSFTIKPSDVVELLIYTTSVYSKKFIVQIRTSEVSYNAPIFLNTMKNSFLQLKLLFILFWPALTIFIILLIYIEKEASLKEVCLKWINLPSIIIYLMIGLPFLLTVWIPRPEIHLLTDTHAPWFDYKFYCVDCIVMGVLVLFFNALPVNTSKKWVKLFYFVCFMLLFPLAGAWLQDMGYNRAVNYYKRDPHTLYVIEGYIEHKWKESSKYTTDYYLLLHGAHNELYRQKVSHARYDAAVLYDYVALQCTKGASDDYYIVKKK